MSRTVLQARNENSNFEDDAIARYMNKKFFVLHHDLYTGEARKIFVNQLSNDDIPAQIFIEDGVKLVGVISVKRLLQEEHDDECIKDMMETTFLHVKPTDDREHIAELLAKNNLDIVAVVENGRLVGCLTEREIASIIEDENTEDAQLQGASLPLDKPYLEMTSFELWKKRSVW